MDKKTQTISECYDANDCHNANNSSEYSNFLTLEVVKYALTELRNKDISWKNYFLKQALVLPLGVLADIEYVTGSYPEKDKSLPYKNSHIDTEKNTVTHLELYESFENLTVECPTNNVTSNNDENSINDLSNEFEILDIENNTTTTINQHDFQNSFTIYEEYMQ